MGRSFDDLTIKSDGNSELENILTTSEKILKHVRIILIAKKIGHISGFPDFRKKIYDLYSEKIIFLIELLKKNKEQLSGEIVELQKTLKGAKNDLKILSGENTLIEIKNLQNTRLDRQIEQFEELQRVLMKI